MPTRNTTIQTDDEVVEKKRRPKETLYTQQAFEAWEPKINCRRAGVLMIFLGIPILLLGIVLVNFISATEIVVSYGTHANCISCRNKARIHTSSHCKSCLPANLGECLCSVPFRVSSPIQTPMRVYYELDNFYQSHRRFVKSRDDSQLLGKIFDSKDRAEEPGGNCHPYDIEGKSKKFYFPCGGIANSFFSDKLTLKEGGVPLRISKADIVWESDMTHKFRNPNGIDKTTYDKKMTKASNVFNKHFRRPVSWDEDTWQTFWANGGLENPDFINWMSPSPFPKLRKFYGTIHLVPSCKDQHTLCPGDYTLDIDYRFAVDPFKGQKSLVLATTSILGTSNPFIGWFATGLGGVLCCLSVLFIIVDKLCKKTKYVGSSTNTRIHPHRPRHHRVPKNPGPPQTPTESDPEVSRVRSRRDRSPSTGGSSTGSNKSSVKNSESISSVDSSRSRHRLIPERNSPQVDPQSRHSRQARESEDSYKHPHTSSKKPGNAKSRKDANKKRAKSAPSPPVEVPDTLADRPKSNPKSNKLKLL